MSFVLARCGEDWQAAEMKKIYTAFRWFGYASVIGLFFCAIGCRHMNVSPKDECVVAVDQLAERLLGRDSNAFQFYRISDAEGSDVFELSTRDDRVFVGGNNANAMAVGLHHYLKNYCNAAVSVNYNQVNLPDPLPELDAPVRVVTSFKYRYLFNYCTFGYSMPWWDWERWEEMIDYMALQGVNLPLAPIGQEAVWQEVYREMGLSDEELDAFFVAPAHLPWGRMGNIDGLGGPLPQGWIDQRRELQVKLLKRMRALGMKPVLQGFTGHVPPSLKEHYPDAKIEQIEPWAGIPGTQFLDPTDPLFKQIGKRFIEKQTEFYGTDHFYDADCFIEVDPPSSDPAFLTELSRGVYESMAAADPEAIWVLQGWFFFFKAKFWQPEQGRAFMDGVPDDRMIVLDLYGEKYPTWKKTDSFFGKPWIWNVICNEDQKVNMSGHLEQMQKNFSEAYVSKGKLQGVGVIPEGIGFNPVVQEFIFEKAWQPENVDLNAWIHDYAARRYGSSNEAAMKAWDKLLNTVYGRSRTMWSPLITSPRLMDLGGSKEDIRHVRKSYNVTENDPFDWDFDVYELAEAAELLLSAADELAENEAYRFDLAHVHRELLHALTHRFIHALSSAYAAKDKDALAVAGNHLTTLLEDLEAVCGSQEQFLLGSWLEDARSWGATDEESDYYERNARTIISIWMPWKNGGLRDYAGKTWNGMFSGYYQPRWELFIQHLIASLADEKPFDAGVYDRALREIDFAWTCSHEKYPVEPTSDVVETARRIQEKYAHWFVRPQVMPEK